MGKFSDLPTQAATKPVPRAAADDEAEGRLIRLLSYVLEGARSRGAWVLAVTEEPSDVLVAVTVKRERFTASVDVRLSALAGVVEPRLMVAQLMGRLDERLDGLAAAHLAETRREVQRMNAHAAGYSAEVKRRADLEADFAAQRSFDVTKIEKLEEQLAEQKRLLDAAVDSIIEQTVLGPIAKEMEMPTPRLRVRPEVLARRAMSDDFTSDEKNVFMNAVRTDEAIGTEGCLLFPSYCLPVVCGECGDIELSDAWDIGSASPVPPMLWGLRPHEAGKMEAVCTGCVCAAKEAPDDEG